MVEHEQIEPWVAAVTPIPGEQLMPKIDVSDDGLAAAGQAALVHFQRQRGDVLVADGVGQGADQRRVGDHGQRRVHQVEDRKSVV